MPREILKPTYGEPLIMRLDSAPVLVEGKFGHQWQYKVNDDAGLIYLDPPAKEAVDNSGAKPGDEIALTKSRQGRSTVWKAEIVEDEPNAFIPQWQEAEYERAQKAAQAIQEPDWVRHGLKAHAAAPIRPNGNGNGHHAPPPATPQPTAPKPEPSRPGSQVLAAALCAAIDAAKAAQDYAHSKGFALAFASEDIRAMAATLYIDQRKEAK